MKGTASTILRETVRPDISPNEKGFKSQLCLFLPQGKDAATRRREKDPLGPRESM